MSLLPLITFCIVRKQKNMRAFEDIEVNIDKVKSSCFKTLDSFIDTLIHI